MPPLHACLNARSDDAASSNNSSDNYCSDSFDTTAFDATMDIEEGETGAELLAIAARPYDKTGAWDEDW